LLYNILSKKQFDKNEELTDLMTKNSATLGSW